MSSRPGIGHDLRGVLVELCAPKIDDAFGCVIGQVVEPILCTPRHAWVLPGLLHRAIQQKTCKGKGLGRAGQVQGGQVQVLGGQVPRVPYSCILASAALPAYILSLAVSQVAQVRPIRACWPERAHIWRYM